MKKTISNHFQNNLKLKSAAINYLDISLYDSVEYLLPSQI